MAHTARVNGTRQWAGRCTAAALFGYLWLQALLAELAARLVAVSPAATIGQRLRSRAGAQGLVEWSIAAAVLALVGVVTWQLAGTAITGTMTRMINNLSLAG